MIWHIFRKDFRLLWRLALAVAAIQFLVAAIAAKTELFYPHVSTVTQLDDVLRIVAKIACMLLLVSLSQQDALPSLGRIG